MEDKVNLQTTFGDYSLTIQTFDDSGQSRKSLAQIFPYDETHIRDLNGKGAGIFFTPNPQEDPNQRSIENTSYFKSISLDLDVCKEKDKLAIKDIEIRKKDLLQKIKSLEIKPNIVIFTKNGLQVIWIFEDPKKLETIEDRKEANELYRRLVAGIAQKTGLKSEGDNLCRVVRLPNYLHLKDPNVPFPIQAILTNAPRVTLEKFIEKYYPIAIEEQKIEKQSLERIIQEGSLEGSRNIDITALIGSLLARYPQEEWENFCYQLIQGHNQSKNTPPLEEKELRSIFESISKRELSKRHESVDLTSHYRNTNQEGGLIRIKGDELANGEVSKLPYLPVFGRPDYLVKGWSHLVAAPPKAGKTEFITQCIKEWIKEGYKIVYFTEEPQIVWKQRLTDSSVDWSKLVLYLSLGISPETLLRELSIYHDVIVIIDTLRNLLGLENENDNSEVARVFNPWIRKSRDIESTLIGVHHVRKGGGKYGEGISGGHALLGSVDIALEIHRIENQPNRRLITGLGRLIKTEDLIYERLDSNRFVALGSPSSLALDEVISRTVDVLSANEWKTQKEIEDALSDPKPGSEQVRKALFKAAGEMLVERKPPIVEGSKRGMTYHWRLLTLPHVKPLIVGGEVVTKKREGNQ